MFKLCVHIKITGFFTILPLVGSWGHGGVGSAIRGDGISHYVSFSRSSFSHYPSPFCSHRPTQGVLSVWWFINFYEVFLSVFFLILLYMFVFVPTSFYSYGGICIAQLHIHKLCLNKTLHF